MYHDLCFLNCTLLFKKHKLCILCKGLLAVEAIPAFKT